MALKSQGTTIEVEQTAVFAALEEVNSISGPDGSANLIETTHLTSTGKEYLQGLADWGRITLECNFTGATKQMFLRSQFAAQAAATNFKIKVPSSGTPPGPHIFAFAAVVTSWQVQTSADDKVTLSITLQVTGAVTYTAPV